MVNNLINYYFYDIKKQWDCIDDFLAAQHEYDKIRTNKLQQSTFTSIDLWYNLRNGNVSIAETLANTTQNNATVLENTLIAKAGAMATAENSTAFLLAWTTGFAYNVYTTELVTATETASTTAQNSSKQLSQQDVENRINYLRAIASAECNATKEKAQATKEYGKDQIDFAADTVINWYSELIYCFGCDEDNEHHMHNAYYDYYSYYGYYYYDYYYGYYGGDELISGYHNSSYYYYDYYYYYNNIWGLNLSGSTGITDHYRYIDTYLEDGEDNSYARP